MPDIARLRDFVITATRVVDRHGNDEPAVLAALQPALANLVAQDDWLPDEYAASDPHGYRQYLLHADPLERFCVVSFVWGVGQRTPVHDHRVWGTIGVLRGAERSIAYHRDADGLLVAEAPEILPAGSVAAVSPSIGDIHAIANARADGASISIHVYGGNMARIERAMYDTATGAVTYYTSLYNNDRLPNLWNRSALH